MTARKLTFREKLNDLDYRVKMFALAFFTFLWARLQDSRPRTIYSFPERPLFFHSLFGIAHQLGYILTTKEPEKADCLIRFEDAVEGAVAPTGTPKTTRPIVNMQATNIRKSRIEEAFRKVAGYGLSIDPRTTTGNCVRKSNNNAMHDGVILSCPCEPEDGYVYQRLIETEVNGRCIDMRVPVVGGTIPLVSYRYKSPKSRFYETLKADIFAPSEVLSDEEQHVILEFSKELNLDFGELDVLRDINDKRIYIVDANNTPARPHPGWGGSLSFRDHFRYTKLIAAAFEKAFITPVRG